MMKKDNRHNNHKSSNSFGLLDLNQAFVSSICLLYNCIRVDFIRFFVGCSFFRQNCGGSGAYNSQNAGYPTYGASYGYDAYGGYEGYDSQSYSWEAQKLQLGGPVGFDDLMVGESTDHNWVVGFFTMFLHLYIWDSFLLVNMGKYTIFWGWGVLNSFFMFTPKSGWDLPFWLTFFNGVETTN